MKANELRIGNLINYNNKLLEFSSKDLQWIEECDIIEEDNHYYTPIELTEEWLKKFGFKINSTREIFHMDSFNTWNYDFSIRNYGDGFELWFDDCPTGIRIEYVHSFQNLYFALTGNELEIK